MARPQVKPITSKVVRNKKGSESVMTSIPQRIAWFLDVSPGDTLIWKTDEAGGHVEIVKSKVAKPKP